MKNLNKFSEEVAENSKKNKSIQKKKFNQIKNQNVIRK